MAASSVRTLTQILQGLQDVGEVFVAEQVIQGHRSLVPQLVLFLDVGRDFAEALPQLHHLGIVVQSAGAVASPQGLRAADKTKTKLSVRNKR